MLQFYVYFCIFLTLMWSVAFLCLTSVTLSQADLLEVPESYLGSLGYFPTRGPVLPDGHPLAMLLLMGGSDMCSLLSLVLYPKHAHSTSRTLTADY
jgi:hypothetical protein